MTAMPDPSATTSLILASASRSRAELLRGAGLDFDVEPARLDEDELKAAMRANGAGASDVAEALAKAKACRTARARPGALVIGADQMLDCAGIWFDKPADLVEAAAHLRRLRDHTHELVTSVCIVQDDRPLWHHTARARLTMRPFSDDFITSYLDRVGPRACDSVGAYQLEGLGAQLFSRIEGDYFTILGLPLLPLLAFLREHGVVAA